MMAMTYEGIGLLHRWQECDHERWYVPPLLKPGNPDTTVTLLELMPGGLLAKVGLPHRGYKGGSKEAADRRKEILQKLPSLSGLSKVSFDDPASAYLACRANDDCLDSVVAAVGAAMWAQDYTRFHHPQPDELADAQLEGWIYVPLPSPPN